MSNNVARQPVWSSWRLPGCGPDCLPRCHDAIVHEAFGYRAARVEASVIRTGPLEIRIGRAEATVDGTPVPLTPNEWRILRVLALSAGLVVGQDTLIRETWGTDWLLAPTTSRHVLRVNVGRLRAKLGPRAGGLIATRKGLGYLLEVVTP